MFHDAYHYFEHRFDIEALGSLALSDATAPSVARVAQIREAVTEAGVQCVFAEPRYNPALVGTVTRERLPAQVSWTLWEPIWSRVQPCTPAFCAIWHRVWLVA